jgi:hypothetical protein
VKLSRRGIAGETLWSTDGSGELEQKPNPAASASCTKRRDGNQLEPSPVLRIAVLVGTIVDVILNFPILARARRQTSSLAQAGVGYRQEKTRQETTSQLTLEQLEQIFDLYLYLSLLSYHKFLFYS